MADIIATSEKEWVLRCIKEDIRMDGRGLFDLRRVSLIPGRSRAKLGQSHVEARIGSTKVLSVVTAEVSIPYPDRPMEGFLSFGVEFLNHLEPGRITPEAVELQRVVERTIKDSKALDTETLCIVAGEKVWSVKCQIHILDDCGNVLDAACLSCIASLIHFQLPEVTTEKDGTVVIHNIEDREPLPLSVHHVPLSFTFGIFEGGTTIILDPTEREEAVIQGKMTITVNSHGELCGIHKAGGTPIHQRQIFQCIQIANEKARDLIEALSVMQIQVPLIDSILS